MIQKIENILKYTNCDEHNIQKIEEISQHVSYKEILNYIDNLRIHNHNQDFTHIIKSIYNYISDKLKNEMRVNLLYNSYLEESIGNHYTNAYNDDNIKISYYDIPYMIIIICIKNIYYNIKSNIDMVEHFLIKNITCSIYYSLYILNKEWHFLTDEIYKNRHIFYQNYVDVKMINEYLIKFNCSKSKEIIRGYSIFYLTEYFLLKNERNLNLESRTYDAFCKNLQPLDLNTIPINSKKYLDKFNIDIYKLYMSYNIVENAKKRKLSNTICLF